MQAEGSRRRHWSGRTIAVAGVTVVVTAAVGLALAYGAVAPSQTPVPALSSPALTDPTTVQISDTNRRLFLEADRDYVVRMPSTAFTVPGGISIVGGRNVVIVGGEIYDNTPIATGEPYDLAYGLYLEGQTGTVHVEGLWIHGRGIAQALVLAQFAGATVQVQSSLLESLHPVGYAHTDGIQSWGGPNRLRLRNVTIRTAGVGIQVQPHTFEAVAIARWEYRRVNVVQTTKDAYALWKGSGHGAWWREFHEDLWVKPLGATAWPSKALWSPGSGGVEGKPMYIGIPPGGDFVKPKSVGVAYKRPTQR